MVNKNKSIASRRLKMRGGYYPLALFLLGVSFTFFETFRKFLMNREGCILEGIFSQPQL